jgi:hypothetical protein
MRRFALPLLTTLGLLLAGPNIAPAASVAYTHPCVFDDLRERGQARVIVVMCV